jgi:hypothetical protein
VGSGHQIEAGKGRDVLSGALADGTGMRTAGGVRQFTHIQARGHTGALSRAYQ